MYRGHSSELTMLKKPAILAKILIFFSTVCNYSSKKYEKRLKQFYHISQHNLLTTGNQNLLPENESKW